MNAHRRLYYLSGAPRVSTHPDSDASGPRTHVLGVIQGFEQLGWEVPRFIVGDRVPRSWTGTGSREAVANGTLRRLAADVARMAMASLNARRAKREAPQGIDWVYERFGIFQSLGRALQREGIPWILETNGLISDEARYVRQTVALGGMAKRLEFKAYQDCDVLVCISEELKRVLVDAARVPAEKIVIVPNGVDPDFFDPNKYQARRVTDAFTIGFVGGLAAWAGVDLLLEALHGVRSEGFDVHAVIVGDGLMRAKLEEMTDSLELRENVTFVGHVSRDEVSRYTLGFDVGYSGQVPRQMGTMWGSPLKIYEYLALGKPVIASAYADARSVIKDGINGYLFDPLDVEGLKTIIIRAFNERARFDSTTIRDGVVAQHSWRSRVHGMIEQIEAILSRKGRARDR